MVLVTNVTITLTIIERFSFA